jgi:hypothetical protein
LADPSPSAIGIGALAALQADEVEARLDAQAGCWRSHRQRLIGGMDGRTAGYEQR